jgi:hypothetical protein
MFRMCIGRKLDNVTRQRSSGESHGPQNTFLDRVPAGGRRARYQDPEKTSFVVYLGRSLSLAHGTREHHHHHGLDVQVEHEIHSQQAGRCSRITQRMMRPHSHKLVGEGLLVWAVRELEEACLVHGRDRSRHLVNDWCHQGHAPRSVPRMRFQHQQLFVSAERTFRRDDRPSDRSLGNVKKRLLGISGLQTLKPQVPNDTGRKRCNPEMQILEKRRVYTGIYVHI